MNTKSEIGGANAQLRDELKEHGDMDYEIMSRSIGERDDALGERDDALGERDDALDERAAVLDRRAAVLDERAAALDERAAALDERDDALDERAAALDERGGDETARPPFGCSPACNRIYTGGLNEGDLLVINRDSITLSRQLENTAMNGVKNRIGGIMGKIKDGVLIGASAIKIWEFFQPVFLMVLSVFGGS